MPASRQIIPLGKYSPQYWGDYGDYAVYLSHVRDRIIAAADPNYWAVGEMVWWVGVVPGWPYYEQASTIGMAFPIRAKDGAGNYTGDEWVIAHCNEKQPLTDPYYTCVWSTGFYSHGTNFSINQTMWAWNGEAILNYHIPIGIFYNRSSAFGKASFTGTLTGTDPTPGTLVYDDVGSPTKSAAIVEVNDPGGGQKEWVIEHRSGPKFRATDSLYVDGSNYLSSLTQNYNNSFNMCYSNYVTMTGGAELSASEKPYNTTELFTNWYPTLPPGESLIPGYMPPLYKNDGGGNGEWGFSWLLLDAFRPSISFLTSNEREQYLWTLGILGNNIIDPQSSTDLFTHGQYKIIFNRPVEENQGTTSKFTVYSLEEVGGTFQTYSVDVLSSLNMWNFRRNSDKKILWDVPLIRNSTYVKGYPHSSLIRQMGAPDQNYLRRYTGPDGPFIKLHVDLAFGWPTSAPWIFPLDWTDYLP